MSRRNTKSIQGITGTPPNRTYNFQYGYGTLTLNKCTKWQSGKKQRERQKASNLVFFTPSQPLIRVMRERQRVRGRDRQRTCIHVCQVTVALDSG